MTTNTQDDKLLTVFQAEELTGRKVSTWRRDISQRRVAVVRFGRSVRIPRSEIERLVRAGYSPAVSIESGRRSGGHD